MPDQLACLVLFVTEDVVVRGNRRRIRHHDLLLLLVVCSRPLVAAGCPLILPLRWLVVLTWPRDFRLLLLFKALVETLNFGSEGVIGLYQLYSKLVKAELLKSLGTLHGAVDIIKTVGCIISPRSYQGQAEEYLPGVKEPTPE